MGKALESVHCRPTLRVGAAGHMNANTYELIIWWSDEDAAYVIEAPELSGWMAHGNTRQSAIRNAEDAIRLWIRTAKEDGLAIPEPRGRLVYA